MGVTTFFGLPNPNAVQGAIQKKRSGYRVRTAPCSILNAKSPFQKAFATTTTISIKTAIEQQH